MFYLILRKRVWVGMMFLKSSWSEPSQTDLSKLSSRRRGGSATNFLFALMCIQQLISPWWSFSRKILFFYVTLKCQSIVFSTPSMLTKEDRKVVTLPPPPPPFPVHHVKLCDLYDLCYGYKNADFYKTVVSWWRMVSLGVAKKWWIAQNSRLHLVLMFSNDCFLLVWTGSWNWQKLA